MGFRDDEDMTLIVASAEEMHGGMVGDDDGYDDPSEEPGSAFDALRDEALRRQLDAKRMQTPVGDVMLGQVLTNAVDMPRIAS